MQCGFARAALAVAVSAIGLNVALFVPVARGQAGRDPFPMPRGYFILNDDNGPYPIPDWAFADPLVGGVSLRAGWGQIEPQEGQYNWFFDQDIERARQTGKQVILRVYTGYRGKRMADWVYAAGAQRFEFSEGTEQMSLPVPWDKTFLAKWTNLIKVLGRKYDGDPAVAMIQMAGLDYTGGEMHLPKSPADKQNWLQRGYSKETLVGAWQTVINAYATAFPHKRLCLNVSVPIEHDGVVEDVMIYCKQKLGKRFCVQHNALAAKTVENGFPHQWVLAAKNFAGIGFQQLCPATPSGKFNDEGRRYGGTLEQSLLIGLNAGMCYLETYKPDVLNQEFRPVLADYAAKMMPSKTQRPKPRPRATSRP